MNLDLSRVDDLSKNLEVLGLRGHHWFSSEESSRLVALLARESELGVQPNLIMRPQYIPEHPLVNTTGIDQNNYSAWLSAHENAEEWWWMNGTDDPSTPEIEGFNVIRAWDYLQYMGVPPSNGEWQPPRVAIIDSGFYLDETTGIPIADDGHGDYFYYGNSGPFQADMIDHDGTAGGESAWYHPGSGALGNWHGQAAFGVAAARSSNIYGGAGTGGPVAVPMLFKIDSTTYLFADVVQSAWINGADVISISAAFPCGTICYFPHNLENIVDLTVEVLNPLPIDLFPREDPGERVEASILNAAAQRTVVVASAGNAFAGIRDLDAADVISFVDDCVLVVDILGYASVGDLWIIPCEVSHVICVGAVGQDGVVQDYSFYGPNVDIWAPAGITATVDPDEADNDANWWGRDELKENYHGTSAAAPYVAGVVALMRALDPTLTPAQIQSIIQETANESTDPLVATGYVNAYEAVRSVKENQPPTLELSGIGGGDVSYSVPSSASSLFRLEVQDPEPGARLFVPDWTRNDYTLAFNVDILSNRDGQICSGTIRTWDSATNTGLFACGQFFNTKPLLSEFTVGTHTITATVTDPFGAIASDSVTINVVNRASEATIYFPSGGITFGQGQEFRLWGQITDPDQPTTDVHGVLDDDLVWESNIDGPLGTGRELWASLSTVGTHTITISYTDPLGVRGEDSITVNVELGGRPTVKITSPDNIDWFDIGTIIQFQGTATDPEDGTLPPYKFDVVF